MARKSNINKLLQAASSSTSIPAKDPSSELPNKPLSSNPAIDLAMGANQKRARSIKEPILQLEHDQVVLFKYHDRHESAIDTDKFQQIKRSITTEGQHFPGIVRKTDRTLKDGRAVYELIVGRIRFEASRDVGVFKAFLKELSDAEAVRVMLSENEDRQDITPFERWLSILPLVEDGILTNNEIADLIGWDKGNLSRSLKAKKFYDECNLSNYLLDVSKVKLHQLIEVASLYEKDPLSVQSAIDLISEKYSSKKDNLFLKAIVSHLSEQEKPKTEKIFLDGSKVIIKKVGNNVSISFDGLPKKDALNEVISTLETIGALK